MKEIPLTQGKVALVDDEDFEYISKFTWHILNDGKNEYAQTSFWHPTLKKSVSIRMHRLIMNPDRNMAIDHINHNGLDNKRANLKICTIRQNNANRKLKPKSGYTGVTLRKSGNYSSCIRVNGKLIHLGTFKKAEDAYNEYLNKSQILQP